MCASGLRRRFSRQAQRQRCGLRPLQDLAACLAKRFSCGYYWQTYGTDGTIRRKYMPSGRSMLIVLHTDILSVRY